MLQYPQYYTGMYPGPEYRSTLPLFHLPPQGKGNLCGPHLQDDVARYLPFFLLIPGGVCFGELFPMEGL